MMDFPHLLGIKGKGVSHDEVILQSLEDIKKVAIFLKRPLVKDKETYYVYDFGCLYKYILKEGEKNRN